MLKIISKYSLFCLIVLLGLSQNVFTQTTDSLKSDKKKFVMKKSPTAAILRSLALPGWGQYYVESYWKAPIFVAAAGTCVYYIVDNNKKFNDKQKQIDKALALNPEDPNVKLYKLQREVYRDNRDQSAFFLAGVYLLSAVDAYVGAHLFDFDVSDKIALQVLPDRNSFVSLMLNVKL